MFLKTRKVVVVGVLVALSILCMFLGSIIEMNTLFFLALAAFCIGIMIREFQWSGGVTGFLAAMLLGFILVPNKLYVFTYIAMGAYIVGVELAWSKLGAWSDRTYVMKVFWGIKYFLFNVIYIPAILFGSHLFIGRKLTGSMVIVTLIVGQVGLWIFDKAYEQFMSSISLRRFRNLFG